MNSEDILQRGNVEAERCEHPEDEGADNSNGYAKGQTDLPLTLGHDATGPNLR